MDESTALIPVFVYGTLRPPQPGAPPDDSRYYFKVVQHIQRSQPAVLHQAVLYHLDTYPAARPGAGRLQGDILWVQPAALPIMDRIEGHPLFFERAGVQVEVEDGSQIQAWIYWAPADLVRGAPRIVSGNWFEREALEMLPEPNPFNAAALNPAAEEMGGLPEVLACLAAAPLAWLSFTQSQGRVFTLPVFHLWLRGKIFVCAVLPDTPGGEMSLSALLDYPNVALAHPDPQSPILVEGWATSGAGRAAEVMPRLQARYPQAGLNPLTHRLYEITPLLLSAWKNHSARQVWDRLALREMDGG